MLEREDVPLAAGTGLPHVWSLLWLKDLSPNEASPLVEVVVMSRNSPETGLRVLNTIGKPTFRGTRILVADVLDQVAAGLAWETIIEHVAEYVVGLTAA